MSTDFADTATAVEEFAVGAAKTVAEVASDPVRVARRQVKTLERRGTPTVRRINRRLNALVPDRLEIFGVEINGRMPEKVAIKGLHRIREQTHRRDVVGNVARRTLRIFNGSFKTIARTAAKLEEASQPSPIRQPESRPAARRSRTRSARRRAA